MSRYTNSPREGLSPPIQGPCQAPLCAAASVRLLLGNLVGHDHGRSPAPSSLNFQGSAVSPSLTQRESKTRLARLPEDSVDFLGYTIGRFYGKDGTPYLGTCPSRKAIRRLLQRIHDATTPHKHADSPEERVEAINRLLRGWAAYFNQGPGLKVYKVVRWYVQRRLQRWLTRRGGQAGTGYRQYPDEYLYGTLGLHALPLRRSDLPSAKA